VKRPIPTAALILYVLLLALGLGIGSAYAVLKGAPPFGARSFGPWHVWPKLGSAEADPYMRAIVARRGDIPLATGEGLALTALVDNSGRQLDSACSYRVGSSAPAARWWTLTVYDADGKLAPSELGRNGFTSPEILRDAQNGFTISLSRALSAGNWLQLPPSGPFSVVLRLYDIPGAAGLSMNAEDLPTIERLECGA